MNKENYLIVKREIKKITDNEKRIAVRKDSSKLRALANYDGSLDGFMIDYSDQIDENIFIYNLPDYFSFEIYLVENHKIKHIETGDWGDAFLNFPEKLEEFNAKK